MTSVYEDILWDPQNLDLKETNVFLKKKTEVLFGKNIMKSFNEQKSFFFFLQNIHSDIILILQSYETGGCFQQLNYRQY